MPNNVWPVPMHEKWIEKLVQEKVLPARVQRFRAEVDSGSRIA